MKNIIITVLKTVVPLAVGVYLMWYFFDDMSTQDVVAFKKAISEANYAWIIASLALSFLALVIRAYRWRYVLEPLGYETKFWHRYHALMIGYLVNFTIPRSGEASRAAMLYRSDGVPFSKSFGTIVAERAVDFAMLLSIVGLTALLSFPDLMKLKTQALSQKTETVTTGFSFGTIIKYAVLAVILFLIYLFVAKPAFRNKFIAFGKDVLAGVFAIFKSKNPLGYIWQTLAIWILYIVVFALPFFALEETKHMAINAILVGFVAGSIGITFTNGGIGAFPLLVGMVVGYYLGASMGDQASSIGKAIGMLIWVSQTLLFILLGLISLLKLPKNYSAETKLETNA
jgi:glycosyltransferase 2 family protein